MSLFHMKTMEEKLAEINSPHQFAYESGIAVTWLEPGLARGELAAGEDSVNPHGQIHGGALYTLSDTVAGCCACSKGGNCVTASSSMEFLRPPVGGRSSAPPRPRSWAGTCRSSRWS